MAAKSRTGKTYRNSHHIVDGEDKDRLIAELYEKIRLLENELDSKQDNVGDPEAGKRMRAERGLKNLLLHPERSSRFTETLLTLLPTPVFYKDTEGRYLGCNRAFSELMGVSTDQIEGKTVAELWPGDLAEMYMSMDRELFKNCVLQVYDYKILDKDGMERPVIYVKDVFRDESDRVAGIVGAFVDITERKRAEEALQVSEAMFNEVLDNLTDAFIILDSKWRYIYVNKIAANLFGAPKEELLGRVVWELWPESVGSVQYEQQLMTMKEKIPRTWIDYSAASDLWYEYRVFPWGDGIASFARDITERKCAEDKLIESEEKFRTLAEISSAVIYVYQYEKLVYVNDAAERITGYSKSELLGMKFWDIMHADDKQIVMERGFARQLGEAAPEQYEIRFVTKAGDVRWAELTARRIIYMGKPAGVATFFDITDRKRIQEALLSSRQMLKDVIDNFPGVVFWKDRFSVYLGCNKNFSTAAGLVDTESIIGKTDFDLPWADTEAEAYLADDRQVMESGMPKLNIIETQRQADGRVAWFDTSKVPLFDANGNVTGVLGASGDITERKQAEEALKAAKEHAELYLDLMCHDINNMHQIALGYLELARNASADAEQIGFLDTSMEVLQRSAQLIQNVRKLQKLQDGTFLVGQVDIARMLADVQREFGSVPNKVITLNPGRRENCHVQANEMLYDVFANLVSNAIKHTRDNADITLSLDEVKENGHPYCKVIVEDNGPGIPDDSKSKIFNRLLRGDSRMKGMGIGLYMAKSIVEGYGGRVWVEDRVPGDHTKGARFVVMLPDDRH